MKTKRSHEGYLLIDNRANGAGVMEMPTITCSHCTKVLIVNPTRTRERAYCPKCDHYICDECGAVRALNGGICNRFEHMIEKAQEAAARQDQRSGSCIILSTK